MSAPVHTPAPPVTPAIEVCPPVPDIRDIGNIGDPPKSFQNMTAMIALQPPVWVATPIIMMSVGIVCNIIAAGVFNCSRTVHREHAFYGIIRGMLYTNIVAYLEIYPIVILGHMNGLHWIGSGRLCKFHGIAILNYGLCLAYLTGALAWERFLATCRPGTYDKKIEKRKVPYIITLMWIVALFTALLPLAGFGRFAEMYPNTWCFLDWRYEETVGRLFCSILATAVAAICLFLISTLVVSTGICVYLTYSERRSKLPVARYRIEVDGYVGNSTANNNRSNGQLVQGARPRHMNASDEDIPHRKYRSHLCWTTFQYSFIASSFFICYIPIVIRIITNVSGRPENLWADLAAVHRFEYYPICLPVIYVLLHKQLWVRITRYKNRRHGQPASARRYQQRPLEAGRSIHEVQRYRRYNDSNHLRGGDLVNNLSRNHQEPNQYKSDAASSSHDQDANHVDTMSLKDRPSSTAKRKATHTGRAIVVDTEHPNNASKRTGGHDDANCQTDAQQASWSPKSPRSGQSRHRGDEVEITVLEQLMDSTERNHKTATNTKTPRRLESVI